MKLSELIKEYRNETKLSQRKFSELCNLSNTYISFIEKEMNPKTGRPLIPTLEQYKKIADGMGISVQQLFEKLDDDAPVNIHSDYQTEHVTIDNIEKFSHIMQYMDREDYDYVIAAFDRAYKKMKEKGVEP